MCGVEGHAAGGCNIRGHAGRRVPDFERLHVSTRRGAGIKPGHTFSQLLSLSQRPPNREGHNARRKTQRTSTEKGSMERRGVEASPCRRSHRMAEPSSERPSGRCREKQEKPCLRSIELFSPWVAREFTGTDRPRVNPESRTHGPGVEARQQQLAVGMPPRSGGQGRISTRSYPSG